MQIPNVVAYNVDDLKAVVAKNQTSNNCDDTDEDSTTSVLTLQEQAAALRAEAESLEKTLRDEQEAKRQKELADIDRWIEECLYVTVPRISMRSGIPSASPDCDSTAKDKNENTQDGDNTIIDAEVERVETSSSSSADPTSSSDSVSGDATTVVVAEVEWLNSVETAAQVLRDERYSHEQVSKM